MEKTNFYGYKPFTVMDLKDKTVWLTGASSGIGEALVYELDKKGARVIISSRQEDLLNLVKAKCKNSDKVFVFPLDLGQLDTLPDKVNEVISQFGPIDLLINNAGIGQRSLIKETTHEVDRKIMDVNYFGTVILTKALLPVMIERKTGQIAVISSIAGKYGVQYRSAYCASKHAMHGFFDSLRAEVDKYNLKVSIICPGFIHTAIGAKALTGSGDSFGKLSSIPNGLGMTPEVCAKKIILALEKEKEEVNIGGFEINSVRLKRFFPRLLSFILKRVRVI